MKKEFVLRKKKVYLLFREKREKICIFIDKQLKKRYIKLLKLFQTAPVLWQLLDTKSNNHTNK